MHYRILPPEEILECTIQLPPSKSVAAREMVMKFIATGCKSLHVDLPKDADCDDIAVLATILGAGVPQGGEVIDVRASGTALRLLTALFASIEGCECRVTGSDRLRERPVAPLVDALRFMGADIKYGMREGFAPLIIKGKKLTGGEIELDAGMSSQFATALMLAAPLMDEPLTIRYKVPTVSAPYVQLTAAMMTRRGIETSADSEGVTVGKGMYNLSPIHFERDWSAASFWYEIAAVSAGWVSLPGLTSDSLQPDRRAEQLFAMVGALTEFEDGAAELSATPELFNVIEADFSDTPDLVAPLAVAACLVGIPFRFSGVANLRHKESDRLAVLRDELEKIGCEITIEHYDDVIAWDGVRMPIRELPVFDSHGDHRIAMALAPVSVYLPGMVLRGAECVSKSYPRFWDDLRSVGFVLVDPSEPMPQREEEQ